MNIDPLARWYRWLEYAAFGRALERRRFAFLPLLAGAKRILVLGEGDGRSLQRLLSVAPTAEIDVVDSSAAMLALVRNRIGPTGRVRLHHQDALTNATWPSASYDAVVTQFFLDCFTEDDARQIIQRITGVVEPGAIWLVSEFAIPPSGWRKWHALIWIRAMYTFFRFGSGLQANSLPPIEKLMREAGLIRIHQESERCGLIVSEVWKF